MKKYEWKSYIEFALYVIMTLFIIWIIASYVNVIIHNNTDCEYWIFNFFNIWR